MNMRDIVTTLSILSAGALKIDPPRTRAHPCPTSAQVVALLGTARGYTRGFAIARDWGIGMCEAVEYALERRDVTFDEIVYEPAYAMHLIFDGYEEQEKLNMREQEDWVRIAGLERAGVDPF